MKKKLFVVLASILTIAVFIVLYSTSKNNDSEKIIVEQPKTKALSNESTKLHQTLVSEGAQDFHYFTITSANKKPIYVELSRKRAFNNESKNEDFQPFLAFPNDKDSLTSHLSQTNTLLVIFKKDGNLHELLTYADATSLFNSGSSANEKSFCSFIPNVHSDTKKSSTLGYSVYTDKENIINKIENEPNKIEQLISDDDIVYEYKVTIEPSEKD
ncbi:hypothetical protein [Enterococcus termitis]|uniref:Uncharacterized protein n=1 Tax=Enterococcus termitis TaxID=332950 RepID=A0A1E5GHU4_9ENTE|nr:hypothetical protein [Enterococcus termitis]OEG12284.1 hypothetical protein BCR25_07000 [Enterococcus termitis]OJG98901.1 hypothetical protein RV18_GL002763 [Enterococcus termitis]